MERLGGKNMALQDSRSTMELTSPGAFCEVCQEMVVHFRATAVSNVRVAGGPSPNSSCSPRSPALIQTVHSDLFPSSPPFLPRFVVHSWCLQLPLLQLGPPSQAVRQQRPHARVHQGHCLRFNFRGGADSLGFTRAGRCERALFFSF